MIDLHTITSPAGPITRASLALDESWSPYVQGTVVMPLPADTSPFDPRDGARIRLTVRRDFGDAWSNAEFTAAHAPSASNDDLTTAYADAPNAQITNEFFRPWNAFGTRDSQTRRFDLLIRSREIDLLERTLTLQVSSDEALLEDHALLATERWLNPVTSLRALCNLVLRRIGNRLSAGTFDAVVPLAALEWAPGGDAYSYLQAAVEAADGRLWCDENRRWHLTERSSRVSGQLMLSTGDAGSLTNVREVISRDGDWFDAVVVTYSWVDKAGITQLRHDVAGDPTASKVRHVVREQSYPGPGAASALRARGRGRGRVLELAAISDYAATPGQAFTVTVPDTPIQTGVVSAVEWTFPEVSMRVTTRGLIDTPDSAWAFLPTGLAWDDIPDDIDWTEGL